jgi:hypothetical protein
MSILSWPVAGNRHRLVPDGLVDEVRGPELQRFDCAVDIPMTGDDDDLAVRVPGFDVFQDLDAVHAGHFDVRDHDIRPLRFEGRDAFSPAAGAGDGISVRLEERQSTLRISVVVDEQDWVMVKRNPLLRSERSA